MRSKVYSPERVRSGFQTELALGENEMADKFFQAKF